MAKPKLSKNLLQMKFMQRTKDEIETEESKESQMFNQNYSYLSKKQKYRFEPSYTFFEDLRFGRISYKGMNLEIEKLMQDQIDSVLAIKKEESTLDDVEMTDAEMAKRYMQYANRSAGFSKSKDRKRKREN